MNTYKGAATMWLADGRQFAATAELSKDASGTWRGTLAFAGMDDLPVLVNVTEGTLSVNGTYGEFVRPDTSDWIVSPRGPFKMRIEGNGDAPF
jgi:hypothetical protein